MTIFFLKCYFDVLKIRQFSYSNLTRFKWPKIFNTFLKAKPSRFYSVRQWKIQKTKAFYAVVASTFSVWSPLKLATLTWVTKVYNLLVESSSSLRIRARRTRHLKGTFLKKEIKKFCENEEIPVLHIMIWREKLWVASCKDRFID